MPPAPRSRWRSPRCFRACRRAGAGVGAWFDHLAAGTSKEDAREIAELLEEERAALIVVGIATDAGRIEQTAVEATRSTLKHLPGTDFDAAERGALEAMGHA